MSIPIPIFTGKTTEFRKWQLLIRDFAIQLDLEDFLLQDIRHPVAPADVDQNLGEAAMVRRNAVAGGLDAEPRFVVGPVVGTGASGHPVDREQTSGRQSGAAGFLPSFLSSLDNSC